MEPETVSLWLSGSQVYGATFAVAASALWAGYQSVWPSVPPTKEACSAGKVASQLSCETAESEADSATSIATAVEDAPLLGWYPSAPRSHQSFASDTARSSARTSPERHRSFTVRSDLASTSAASPCGSCLTGSSALPCGACLRRGSTCTTCTSADSAGPEPCATNRKGRHRATSSEYLRCSLSSEALQDLHTATLHNWFPDAPFGSRVGSFDLTHGNAFDRRLKFNPLRRKAKARRRRKQAARRLVSVPCPLLCSSDAVNDLAGTPSGCPDPVVSADPAHPAETMNASAAMRDVVVEQRSLSLPASLHGAAQRQSAAGAAASCHARTASPSQGRLSQWWFARRTTHNTPEKRDMTLSDRDEKASSKSFSGARRSLSLGGAIEEALQSHALVPTPKPSNGRRVTIASEAEELQAQRPGLFARRRPRFDEDPVTRPAEDQCTFRLRAMPAAQQASAIAAVSRRLSPSASLSGATRSSSVAVTSAHLEHPPADSPQTGPLRTSISLPSAMSEAPKTVFHTALLSSFFTSSAGRSASPTRPPRPLTPLQRHEQSHLGISPDATTARNGSASLPLHSSAHSPMRAHGSQAVLASASADLTMSTRVASFHLSSLGDDSSELGDTRVAASASPSAQTAAAATLRTPRKSTPSTSCSLQSTSPRAPLGVDCDAHRAETPGDTPAEIVALVPEALRLQLIAVVDADSAAQQAAPAAANSTPAGASAEGLLGPRSAAADNGATTPLAFEPMLQESDSGLNLTYVAERATLRNGLNAYRTRATFKRATAAQLRNFNLRDDLNASWNYTVCDYCRLNAPGTSSAAGATVDVTSSESAFFYQRCRFPLPMACREYVSVRRVWHRPADGGCYVISKACDNSHADGRFGKRAVRVTDYISAFIVREEQDDDGVPTAILETIYFEDSGVPAMVANAAVRKQLWSATQVHGRCFRKFVESSRASQDGEAGQDVVSSVLRTGSSTRWRARRSFLMASARNIGLVASGMILKGFKDSLRSR